MMREEGRIGLLSNVLTFEIAQHIELGNWAVADAMGAEARQLAQEAGNTLCHTQCAVLEAQIAAFRGDNERAQTLANEVEQLATSSRLSPLLTGAQIARGCGWLSEGRYLEAFDALARIFDRADTCRHVVECGRAVMYLAEAANRAERIEPARTIITRLEKVARVTPSVTLHVHLSYARAVLACDIEAEGFYLAALNQDLELLPWARARIELAYGCWLRRQRRVAECRALLRAARETLSRIGAATWAEQASAELRAAGERATAPRGREHELLSPQEMQIAVLAADGLSNREIGERLYLSHRTVGSHLYRIFPKLGIASRSQLARQFAAMRLPVGG